jgi:hypothetical protein
MNTSFEIDQDRKELVGVSLVPKIPTDYFIVNDGLPTDRIALGNIAPLVMDALRKGNRSVLEAYIAPASDGTGWLQNCIASAIVSAPDGHQETVIVESFREGRTKSVAEALKDYLHQN